VIQVVDVLLGLDADAPESRLTLRPALPEWLSEIRLSNLGLGPGSVDLIVGRQPDGSHRLETGPTPTLKVGIATNS